MAEIRTSGRRLRRTASALLLAGSAGLLGACGSGAASSAPPTPGPEVGTAFSQDVPAAVLHAPLRDAGGRPTDLSAYRGKVVVLGDGMTLCQEVCPLLSANFTALARETDQRGLGNDVVFVQLTVDPQRDTPARLAAYRKLFAPDPPNWVTLTGSPASVARIWKFFGVSYDRVPEDQPPGTDWLTGKPLTYDVEHADIVLALDREQRERFLINAEPATQGKLPPQPLQSFLSDQGRQNLANPDPQFSWTTGQVHSVVEWLLGRRYGTAATADPTPR